MATTLCIFQGDVESVKNWLLNWDNLKKSSIERRQLSNLGIRFVPPSPLMQTIGNTMVYDAYIKSVKLGRSPKNRLVMLVPEEKYKDFVNPHLLNYWRQYIDIINDDDSIQALKPLENILTANDFDIMEINGKVVMPHSALILARHYWNEEKRQPLFTLTKEDRNRGEEELQKLGIPESDWFVCLHVREGGARFSEPFRQANVADYKLAIEEITSRGGWVVRMGDNSMAPMEEMKRVIDYPHSNSKSDFMDVFLCGACSFLIGTSSGVYTIAQIFGRPIVQTNYLPTGAVCLSQQDLFLPKLLRENSTLEVMPFNKLFGTPVSLGASDYFFRQVLNVTPIDNTPEELKELVTEMLDRLENKKTYSDEEQQLQMKFKKMTADVETVFGLPGIPINPRMGQHYLNKYKHLMPSENALEETISAQYSAKT